MTWVFLIYVVALVYVSVNREKVRDMEELGNAWFWFAILFIAHGVIATGLLQRFFGIGRSLSFRAGEGHFESLQLAISTHPVTLIFFGISVLKLGKALVGPKE